MNPTERISGCDWGSSCPHRSQEGQYTNVDGGFQGAQRIATENRPVQRSESSSFSYSRKCHFSGRIRNLISLPNRQYLYPHCTHRLGPLGTGVGLDPEIGPEGISRSVESGIWGAADLTTAGCSEYSFITSCILATARAP